MASVEARTNDTQILILFIVRGGKSGFSQFSPTYHLEHGMGDMQNSK